MEDEKKTNPNPDKQKESKQKEGKQKNRLVRFFSDLKGEFRKIIWPNRKELAKQTGVVIVTSIIIGAIIAVFDSVFGFAYSMIVQLLG